MKTYTEISNAALDWIACPSFQMLPLGNSSLLQQVENYAFSTAHDGRIVDKLYTHETRDQNPISSLYIYIYRSIYT